MRKLEHVNETKTFPFYYLWARICENWSVMRRSPDSLLTNHMIQWSIPYSFASDSEWWGVLIREGGGGEVGSSLEFYYFVGSQLKSSISVGSR